MRNMATRHDVPGEIPLARRASMPEISFLSKIPVRNASGFDDEEQAVAGRLEIRVVDANGGATIVQTSADKQPLQSKLTIILN